MSARLANLCTRPVELHLSSGAVVVLPAMAEMACAAEDLQLGQVLALTARGVLAVHPEDPVPLQAEEPPPPRARTRTGTRATKKSTSTTRRPKS